jgi:F0F1-type ATP synthase membrane subunit b/b'
MFELVKRIQAIIDAYHENSEQLAKEIKRIVEEWGAEVNTYSMQYINEQIRNEVAAARSNADKINKVYNQKLKVILDEAKGKVLPELKKTSRPSDYATQVNNALQFLVIEAEQINDDTAYMILKDFIDDLDQMKLFKNVIGKRVDLIDPNGNTTFPKTFGKLNKVEMVMNTFDEMESIANMLFIYPREDGETYIMNGQSYSVPVDSYEQMADEESIIGFAEIIEEYAKTIPGIDQVTDKTDPETVEE